jgi:phosphatidylserine/phosphatidylglycerophosphate/cardiolipin synthase-like enzyme
VSWSAAFVFVVALAAWGLVAAAPLTFLATGEVELAFTPGEAIDNLIIGAINNAKSELLVHAYTFTHRRIAQTLVAAHRRGVTVPVVADREQARAVPRERVARSRRGWCRGVARRQF